MNDEDTQPILSTPTAPPEPVLVKIIERGNAHLLEWRDSDGAIHRGYVPSNMVMADNGTASVLPAVLLAAAPYGDDLSSLIPTIAPVSPSDVAQAFHEAGLWSARDILNNSDKARGVVNSLNPIRIRELVINARRLSK